MRAYWIRLGPKSKDCVLLKDREGHTGDTRTKAKTGAEIGMMLL